MENIAEVKRIYFRNDKNGKQIMYPFFEMKDGSLREPIVEFIFGKKVISYMTDEEFYNKKSKNEEKTKNKKLWKI